MTPACCPLDTSPRRAVVLNCSDCGTPLKPNPRRLGTRCKPCGARVVAQSPDKREKCRVAMKRRFEDAAFHGLHNERIGAGIRRSLQDPARLEAMRASGRKCGLLNLGHNRHGPGSPERIAAGRKRTETVLGWCPLEYRTDYFNLIHTKHVRAPEARRMVEDMMARDHVRFIRTGKLPQSQRMNQAKRKEAS